AVGIGVGLGDAPGAGAAGAPRPCGEGAAWANKSRPFWVVSVPFPSAPPGDRATLDPVGGAAAASPSTNPFVASPHATESMTDPPTTRSAIAPPVAAKPLEYVPSATIAKTPDALASRIRLPGSSTSDVVQVAFRVTVEPDDVA